MPVSVCPSGHTNEPQWRYCIECGAPLEGTGLQHPVGPVPSGGLSPTSQPVDPAHRGREYLIALGILLVALAVAAATLAFVLRQHSTALASDAVSRRSSAATGATARGGDPRVAAVAVNRLLVASEASRSSVEQAVGQVSSCSDVTGAIQTLLGAAADRQHLIAKLGGLDLSALPTSMVDDLTSSWLNSLDSDISYARWAQDESRNGCSTADYSDSNYQAATDTDGHASSSKSSFLALWDPLAQSNGLPEWKSDQI